MGIKALGNPTARYNAVWDKTAKGAVTPAPTPVVEASGGTTGTYSDPDGDWKYHKWQNGDPAPSMTFVVTAGGEVEWLVVGGGGGGGASKSGAAMGKGGGGGGFRSSAPEGPGGPSPTVEPTLQVTAGVTYPITVGAGGEGGPGAGGPNGYYGGHSVITDPTGTPIRSEGGGGGANWAATPAPDDPTSPENGFPLGLYYSNGGSGGGGNGGSWPGSLNMPWALGNITAGSSPTTPVPNQGYPAQTDSYGGSGGGAGGAATGGPGTPGATDPAGRGAGKASSITGSPVTYASGGRATGANASPPWPHPGTAHTGQGGNGAGSNAAPTSHGSGGDGGSGIVVIRYLQ